MYMKPELRSYSALDILEQFGAVQTQYTQHSATLYTTTGNSAVNVDGYINTLGGISFEDDLLVGDHSDNSYNRGLFGFNISSISGTVVSATLRVYQYSTVGTPYTALGNVIVDHVNFGSSIDTGDLSGGTITSNVGTISSSTTVEWKTLDVKNAVQADINAGRTSSQFRLRFSTDTDSDSGGDRVLFEDAENLGATGNRPELVITYT